MWTISAWATGTHRTTGEKQAVRIQLIRPDHDVNEEYGLRAEATGLYRREYGAWADVVGSSAVSDGGEERAMAPGELKADGDYTVPDEAVPTIPPE